MWGDGIIRGMAAATQVAREAAPAAKRDDLEQALFGSDPTPGIVAIETQDDTAVLFRREKGGETQRENVPFRPWVVLRERRDLPDAEYETLDGKGYNLLVRFGSWRSYLDGRRILRDERHDFLSYGAASKQFLMGTGRTLFKAMAFPDIRRMQVDIETTDLSPQAPGACIFLIAASDNQGHEEVLIGDEREMLQRLNDLIQTWDPDVIEGHNLYAFDLPWLRARAKAHSVPLPWGRDGSEIAVGQ